MAEYSLALVTGATGFIGEHLVHRLVQEGTRVRALIRPRPKTDTDPSHLPRPLRTNAVEITWGDITDAAAVAQAAKGVKVVYHLAGLARPWARDPDEFRRVNEDGTANVVRACKAQNLPRLVHVSTNLVNPPSGADPTRYLLTPYQSTKRDAETLVSDYVTRGGDAVIVRPTRVYGPGLMSEANAATLMINLYRRGLFRVRIADRGAEANWVHVQDVVTGCLAAARRGTAGVAYTLGGENATFRRVLEALALATGKRRLVAAVPLPLSLTVAWAAEQLGRLGVKPVITRDWVRLLSLDWPEDSALANRELDYVPRGINAGFRDTVTWLEAGMPPWHS